MGHARGDQDLGRTRRLSSHCARPLALAVSVPQLGFWGSSSFHAFTAVNSRNRGNDSEYSRPARKGYFLRAHAIIIEATPLAGLLGWSQKGAPRHRGCPAVTPG